MSEEEQDKEGWMSIMPPQARKAHYILGSMALCRKFGFYFAPLEAFKPGEAKRDGDCAECYRRAVKRHAAPQS